MLPAILEDMKQGGRKKVSVGFMGFAAGQGFTIVETLIVLAVTSVLFMSAAIMISGRQAKTEFMTASNYLQQQLQDAINQAASGNFPNSNNFSCTAGAGAMPHLANDTSNGTFQGTNGECIFLGKAFQLGASDAPNSLMSYVIAGNRQLAGSDITQLSDAFPEAVAAGVTNNVNLNGVTTNQPIQAGLTLVLPAHPMTDNTGTALNGFAVISSLASTSNAAGGCGGICSGSQHLTLYGIRGGGAGTFQSRAAYVDILDASGSTNSVYVPASTVTFCMDGGINRSAVYTIGGATSSSMGVTMQIQTRGC
jgi:prepilin-type N-terminal cleavage/methylation domain-containing protein